MYHPVNAQELFGVPSAPDSIALAQQALLRVARLEAGLFTCAPDRALDRSAAAPIHLMSEDLVAAIDVLAAQKRNFALADGFRQMVSQSDTWKLFLRYQAETGRRGALWARRAIKEFERLKALRAELPNEPILEAEPVLAQPLEPPPNEPLSFPETQIPGHQYDLLDCTPGTPPRPQPFTEPVIIAGVQVHAPVSPSPRVSAESNGHSDCAVPGHKKAPCGGRTPTKNDPHGNLCGTAPTCAGNCAPPRCSATMV